MSELKITPDAVILSMIGLAGVFATLSVPVIFVSREYAELMLVVSVTTALLIGLVFFSIMLYAGLLDLVGGLS